jgi:hypothetical protein
VPPPSIVEISFGSEILGGYALLDTAVPAMPDGHAVDADEPLEPGKPCEQDDLDERRVSPEQAGEPRERGDELTGTQVVACVPTVHPEPDDRRGVSEEEGPENGRDDEAARAVGANGCVTLLEDCFRHVAEGNRRS